MANLSSTRVFGDASVERSLYVKQRLGVGVGNPSERIEVGGESYPQIRFDTSDGNSTIWNVGFAGDYAFQIRNQNTSDTHVTVNPGGNVGINTTSPSYQLDVNGDINAQNTLRSSGNVVSPDNDPDAHHAVFEPADYTPVSDVEAHGNALVIDITGDADTVDGYEGSDLAALAENETFTNGLNITGGNVGIGTDSPNGKLDIQQDGNTGQEAIRILRPDGTVSGKLLDYQGDFSFEGSNGSDFRIGIPGSGSAEITVEDTGATTFDRAGSEVMRLNDNGNVGIGTSSPSSPLDVQDFVHLGTGVDGQDAANNIVLGDFFGDPTFKIAGSGGPSNDFFFMSPNTSNQFEIKSGGNLVVRAEDNQNFLVGGNIGIGTTAPDQPLDVEGAADLNGRLDMRGNSIKNIDKAEIDGAEGNTYEVRGGDNTSHGISVRAKNNPPGDHTIFAVESSGGATRFGVTQNNGGFFRNQLWVNSGGATDNGEINNGDLNGFSLYVEGDIAATGDVVAFYSSDRRLKKNSAQIENPMAKIEKLTGVGFDWKEESPRNGSAFGIFAQDAKKIDERIVRKQSGGYLGVDYQQLHGIEIEALKQINEDVKENQSRIQKLENKVEQLQNKINQLKE